MDVIINDKKVAVKIIRKNNKNIYFRFKADLCLYVTCHKLVSDKEILKLISKNNDSLIKMLEHQMKKNKNDELFMFLGNHYTVVYDENNKKTCFDENMIFTKNEKELTKFINKEIKRIFEERVFLLKKLFADLPEFSLKIRNMKTRWGVCNKTRKTVTLNSELIKKDVSLIDYVIIHELCHFKYPHHQKSFWDHVSTYYPDYKRARKQLKEV